MIYCTPPNGGYDFRKFTCIEKEMYYAHLEMKTSELLFQQFHSLFLSLFPRSVYRTSGMLNIRVSHYDL